MASSNKRSSSSPSSGSSISGGMKPKLHRHSPPLCQIPLQRLHSRQIGVFIIATVSSITATTAIPIIATIFPVSTAAFNTSSNLVHVPNVIITVIISARVMLPISTLFTTRRYIDDQENVKVRNGVIFGILKAIDSAIPDLIRVALVCRRSKNGNQVSGIAVTTGLRVSESALHPHRKGSRLTVHLQAINSSHDPFISLQTFWLPTGVAAVRNARLLHHPAFVSQSKNRELPLHDHIT
ncbi:hypothetical protein ARSEF1564_004893 [Beauveria bassiana]